MTILFVVLGVSLVVAALVWAVVTGMRVWSTGAGDRDRTYAVLYRRHATKAGAFVPAGTRAEREEREIVAPDFPETYEFGPYGSSGIPPGWFEDVWVRRN